MRILAISGSTRKESLNRKLLRAIQHCSTQEMQIKLFDGIGTLPIFNQDLECDKTPDVVLDFCHSINNSDGLLISSPEYVRAIPGGLKNAIDWLVSRQEIVKKPIALAHASHRGDDMLSSLRVVLSTVSERFSHDIFLRIPLQAEVSVTEESIYKNSKNVDEIAAFLTQYRHFIVHGSQQIPESKRESHYNAM